MQGFVSATPLLQKSTTSSAANTPSSTRISSSRGRWINRKRMAPCLMVAPVARSGVTRIETAGKSEISGTIQRVNGVDEYLKALETGKDGLVVLKVFAPWCRSCRALEPKVQRLAMEFQEVKFLEMNYEENKQLCWRLGVSAMPTFIFYRGEEGEIDKFSCGPKRGDIIREKVLQALGLKTKSDQQEEEEQQRQQQQQQQQQLEQE